MWADQNGRIPVVALWRFARSRLRLDIDRLTRATINPRKVALLRLRVDDIGVAWLGCGLMAITT